MGLPNERDYDATDTGTISHTTINNIQDAIIDGKYGYIDQPLDLLGGFQLNTQNRSGSIRFPDSTASVVYSIPLVAGTVLETITVTTWVEDPSTAGIVNVTLVAADPGQANSSDYVKSWDIATSTPATGGTTVIDSTDLDDTSTIRLPFTANVDTQLSIRFAKTVGDIVNLTSVTLRMYRP